MDAWESEPRVRPIPVDEEELPEWEARTAPLVSEHWTRRPWLPIALTTIAAVGVLTSVTLFGAIEQDDPVPALDAFPFADVRQLQEVIPDITDRLTLIVIGPEGPATLLWDPSFVDPRVVDIQHPVEGDFEYEASFDSSGRFVALASTAPQSDQISLRAGIPTDLGTVDLDDVDSYQWHATEVGRLSYVQKGASGEPTLYTAVIEPFSRLLFEITEVAIVADSERLARWDTSGFILTGTDPSTVRALDSSGVPLWSEPGVVLATSGHTVFISPSAAEGNVISTVNSFDRDGQRLAAVLDEPTDADASVRTMTLSANSDLAATVNVTSGVTTLTVEGPQLSSAHIVVHDAGLIPLGFTSNDAFFVFADGSTNDLVFVKWDIGEVYTLDVPDGFDVVGLDIG